MQAFLASLDLDYHQIYTCERCSEGNLTVIMDGKEMGIRHIHARKHERPLAVGAATVNIDWYAVEHVLYAICFCTSLASSVLIMVQTHGVNKTSTWHGLDTHNMLPPALSPHSSLDSHPVACLTAEHDSPSCVAKFVNA